MKHNFTKLRALSVMVVYVMFGLAFFLSIELLVVSLIISYLLKNYSDEITESHLTYLVRTFWYVVFIVVVIVVFHLVLLNLVSIFDPHLDIGSSFSILNLFPFLGLEDTSMRWVGLVLVVILIAVDLFFLISLIVWYIVRLYWGIKTLYLGQQIPNPHSWRL